MEAKHNPLMLFLIILYRGWDCVVKTIKIFDYYGGLHNLKLIRKIFYNVKYWSDGAHNGRSAITHIICPLPPKMGDLYCNGKFSVD